MQIALREFDNLRVLVGVLRNFVAVLSQTLSILIISIVAVALN